MFVIIFSFKLRLMFTRLFINLLRELINLDADSIQSLVSNESVWFGKLLTFVWSHFDNNIDVILIFEQFLLLDKFVSEILKNIKSDDAKHEKST